MKNILISYQNKANEEGSVLRDYKVMMVNLIRYTAYIS